MKSIPLRELIGTGKPLIDPFSPAVFFIAQPNASLDIPQNKVFAYILAADALYKTAKSRYFTITIPLARWTRPLPGLTRIPYGLIMHRLPSSLLDAVLSDARRASWAKPVETMYQFIVNDGRIRVQRPPQRGTYGRLNYTIDANPSTVILEIHSHHIMDANFSPDDDYDETGLRLYGVIGHIYNKPACIRFRAGVYGDFHPLPASSIFRGDITLKDLYHDR